MEAVRLATEPEDAQLVRAGLAEDLEHLRRRPLAEDQSQHEDQQDEEHDSSSDVQPSSKNEYVHLLCPPSSMVVPHANSPGARLRYPGRISQPYLDGGMLVQTDDLNRASDGLRRVHEHHRPRPVARPSKGKDRSDPAAVYECQLAEIEMDWVVPVKVRQCERELRRREEVKPFASIRYAQSTISKVR